MVLGFVSVVSCIFAFCLLLLPFPQMCGSGEAYRAGRGGCQPLEVLAGWVVTALAWNWRFLCGVCFDSSPRPKMHWLFFFFFHIGVPVDSPCLVDAKDSGATMTCGGGRQGFPFCPANGGSSDLTLYTYTPCSSLQTLLPKQSTRATVWIFQVPGGGLGTQASN